MYTVYKHTNKLNRKAYTGITRHNPQQRWNDGKGYTNHKIFNEAIQKYGWHNFRHEILATYLSESEAKQQELSFIKQYRTGYPSGYNIQKANVPMSQEHRMKISYGST